MQLFRDTFMSGFLLLEKIQHAEIQDVLKIVVKAASEARLV